MASSTDSNLSGLAPLDRLIRERRDVAAVREKEDCERIERQNTSDEIFARSQDFKMACWENTEEFEMARERSDQEAALVLITERQERELAKLLRRYENEVRIHAREAKRILDELQESFDVSIGEVLWNVETERRARSDARKAEEEGIQQSRAQEDNAYKEEVFRTTENEIHRPAQSPSLNLDTKPVFSNNKRAFSDSNSIYPQATKKTCHDVIPRVLQVLRNRSRPTHNNPQKLKLPPPSLQHYHPRSRLP